MQEHCNSHQIEPLLSGNTTTTNAGAYTLMNGTRLHVLTPLKSYTAQSMRSRYKVVDLLTIDLPDYIFVHQRMHIRLKGNP